MWENNEYRMIFKEDTVHDYEQIMLSSGECSFLFPMVFMEDSNRQVAYYNCSGYAPLSRYRIGRVRDALQILESTLLMLDRVAEYLITPARVTISLETVFFNRETGDIKIAYVPMAGEAVSQRRNVLDFIGQLRKDVKDDTPGYLAKLAELVYYNNYQIHDLIGKIGMFRRELYRSRS